MKFQELQKFVGLLNEYLRELKKIGDYSEFNWNIEKNERIPIELDFDSPTNELNKRITRIKDLYKEILVPFYQFCDYFYNIKSTENMVFVNEFDNLKIYAEKLKNRNFINDKIVKYYLALFDTVYNRFYNHFKKEQAEYNALYNPEPAKKTDSNGQPIDENLKLEKLLKKGSHLVYLMNQLADMQLINRFTYLNIDKKKGHRKTYISLMYDMYAKGYFSREPSKLEIVTILQNTFNVETSTENFRKLGLNPMYQTIKYASEIE